MITDPPPLLSPRVGPGADRDGACFRRRFFSPFVYAIRFVCVAKFFWLNGGEDRIKDGPERMLGMVLLLSRVCMTSCLRVPTLHKNCRQNPRRLRYMGKHRREDVFSHLIHVPSRPQTQHFLPLLDFAAASLHLLQHPSPPNGRRNNSSAAKTSGRMGRGEVFKWREN